MQIGTITRTDPFDRLDALLRRGNEIAQKKLAAKGVEGNATLPPVAADEADQAYGAAMSLIAGEGNEGLTQHTLDADRVAALLDL